MRVPAMRTPATALPPLLFTGLAARSAFGRGAPALLAGALAGQPAFGEVQRFDVSNRRVRTAATGPGSPDLVTELVGTVDEACDQAGLPVRLRADCPLLLAVHGDPARPGGSDRMGPSGIELAEAVATRCGLARPPWAYTSACVAATTAVSDAAAMVGAGDCDRVVVAAGYLVEPDQFALFDAGRVLALDGVVRPFSAQRKGLLLGDGVAAVLVESASAARSRGVAAQGLLCGWGRCGDAYHVCAPRPDGAGLGRAIVTALRRARVNATQVGYVNAHGSGTAQSDVSETRALYRALGPYAAQVPVSSTKSTHGQALEASGLLELVITVLALRAGLLPVNAGFLAADPECALNLVLDRAQPTAAQYALSVNMAFGGANTALLVGAP
jgi:3-oxoacyl-(acyl-carrier-protein) synthase